LPSFINTVFLLSSKPNIKIHTYGWEWGGSAAIVCSLILNKFLNLLKNTIGKNYITCRVMSPKPFLLPDLILHGYIHLEIYK